MADVLSAIAEAGKNFAAKTGGKIVAALTGIDASQLENIMESLNQPSLCYVPIQSESLSMRRTVEIGTTMLISQTDQKKDYVTDNAAPRPRTWSGSGYITALVPLLENYLVIKPTLQAQIAILDAAADSRQPVKFKTDTGEVVDVLVQDLQISSTPKGMNVRQVTYTVQEVKVLENSIFIGVTNKILSKTGANSVPVRAMINLGKSSAIGSGVSNTVSGLLSIKF
jgi:hypothetical protein